MSSQSLCLCVPVVKLVPREVHHRIEAHSGQDCQQVHDHISDTVLDLFQRQDFSVVIPASASAFFDDLSEGLIPKN